jgi:hypothetical protein
MNQTRLTRWFRRHQMRAQGRKGLGWKRWSKPWRYNTLGLFKKYQVTWQEPDGRKPASQFLRRTECR